MKKVILALAVAFLVFACDDGNVEKGKKPNPYPDGVYPFEVSNVNHVEDNGDHTITWDNPTDSGFKKVQIEVWQIVANIPPEETMFYSSVTGEYSFLFYKLVLGKNSFLYSTSSGVDFLIIKCVDKFGNVSEGVKYTLSS